jgi:hypothetical protein
MGKKKRSAHNPEVEFTRSAIKCLANARRLIKQADILHYDPKNTSTGYALAILAQEETVKAFLLFLVSCEGLPWNPQVCRSLRDHVCKQLWFVVLDALVADANVHRLQNGLPAPEVFDASGCLLDKVADVLNWYRYAKIETWDQGYCDWDEEPADNQVRGIVSGKLDRRKQNALYVGISNSGKVTSSPDSFTVVDAEQAIKVAEAYHAYVSDLIGILGGYGLHQVEWLKGLLKAIFTPPVRTGREIHDRIPGVVFYEESRIILQSRKPGGA